MPSFRPPSGKLFCTLRKYFTISNGVFIFNFLAFLLSGILVGPKFTLGGPMPPGRPLADIFLTKASTSQYLILFLISTF